jgi:4-deoxy-L-threo-5-hexosulose-uronate ketol-isomerase
MQSVTDAAGVTFDERYAVHPRDYRGYDTRQLRDSFLVTGLFPPGGMRLTYTHYERVIVGGVCPTREAVSLPAVDVLRATHFLERRELGAINVGGAGWVRVDDEDFEIQPREALYVGRGARQVSFGSLSADEPAKFYLNSAPAHRSFPTRKVGRDEADVVELGSPETSNARVLRKLLVNTVIETCQLQMGMTELQSGSVWNTMPAHTHSRRMEAYFYFGVPEGQAVCHFMGPAEETRHIWVQNEQAVISPPWSMHCGAGTSSYSFIWGMAGENLDYADMDHVPANRMR